MKLLKAKQKKGSSLDNRILKDSKQLIEELVLMQDDYIKSKFLQYKKAENTDNGLSFLQRMFHDIARRDFSSKVSHGLILNDPNLSVV